MEAGAQIKKYRNNMKLSQDELAEKIYVSRQTISNWETGKNYPDIHSLLLLSTLFNVSLDQLVKGDVEIMKEGLLYGCMFMPLSPGVSYLASQHFSALK